MRPAASIVSAGFLGAILFAACSPSAGIPSPTRPSDSGAERAGPDASSGPTVERPDGQVAVADTFPVNVSAAWLADELSRLIWAEEAGDPALVAQAALVRTSADVQALTRRMLRDARARRGVSAFVGNWLGTAELRAMEKLTAGFTPELRRSMERESGAFAEHVVFEGDGRFRTLLTAPYTFVDEQMARHYGLAGTFTAEFTRHDFPSAKRIGILGQAGVLARYGGKEDPLWPPRRYWLLTETLLCEDEWNVSPPSTPPDTRKLDAARPLRDQVIEITSRPDCVPCHSVVNELGFAFMAFDTLGREAPPGAAPVTAGHIPERAGLPELAFADQPDLMRKLSGRASVLHCFARNWLAHALNAREPQPPYPDFAGSLEAVASRFAETDGDIQELMIAVASSRVFLSPP
jgi:hypothetical protein